MEFIKVKTYEEMSRKAADIILSQISEKKDSVLGLATGSTPVGTYRILSGENADFSLVKTVNLDEYCGLSGDNEQSYRCFMNKNLFNNINIDLKNTYVPNGKSEDEEQECKRYDKIIEGLGGVDLQILGIGVNGHIGFNEPGDSFENHTHIVNLNEQTIKSNSRFFEREEDVPKRAITMGIGSIVSAKKILLLANGEAKKDILHKALYGEITPLVPASILQKHNNLTVIFSEE